MDNIYRRLNARKSLIILGAVLIFFWVFPWGKTISFEGNLYITFLLDMVKLGVAFCLFILPGGLLFLLLGRESGVPVGKWSIIPVGFALSVALIGIVGIVGRILGLSFTSVKYIFALIGLGELLLLSFFKPDFSLSLYRPQIFGYLRKTLENFPLFLALILATFMTFNEHLFFIDDTIYQAYLMNWQHSTQLGFNNIVHQANVVEHVRFWLALYPMGQALLSDLSGVPGILLFGNYLELFLVPLAVVTSFWFSCMLGLSRKAAGFSTLVQVLFYTMMISEHWPVGFWFFFNMAEDKVSAVFLLAPVFFIFVLRYLRAPVRANIALVLLSGIGLVLTHPVILFFSCAIAAGMGVFSWLVKKTNWREILPLGVIFILLMTPYLAIRLYSHPSQRQFSFDAQSASTTYQVARYTNVVNDIFYGLNPEVLKTFDIEPEDDMYSAFQIFRLLPVILALTAGVLAWLKLKEGALYWYVLSCVILVVLATIPYTGWILGYFVSARLISRASWFSPLGLAGLLVFAFFQERAKHRFVSDRKTGSFIDRFKWGDGISARIPISLFFVITLFLGMVMPRVAPYFEKLDYYRRLAKVGAYIDQNTKGPTTVIALEYRDTQLLPGVSANSSLISFREETDLNGHNYFLSIDEIHERIYASNIIQSLEPDISNEERCRSLQKYDVEFVVAHSDTAGPFMTEIEKCHISAKSVFEIKDMVLLKLE